MATTRFCSGVFSVVLALISADVARAQPVAASLEDLKAHRSAKTVIVVDAEAHRFQGTLVDASESLLRLRTGDRIRQFHAVDIRSVHVRDEDSLANGALLGAAVGGGLTSLLFLDNECRADPLCYRAVGMYAGVGALAGLAVDALILRPTIIYSAPSRQRFLRVVPMASGGRRAVGVTIDF